jgi:hypothetical protein
MDKQQQPQQQSKAATKTRDECDKSSSSFVYYSTISNSYSS